MFVKPYLGPLDEMNTDFQTLANTVLQVFSIAALLAQSTLFSAQGSLHKDKSQDFVQESFTWGFKSGSGLHKMDLQNQVSIHVMQKLRF